LAASRQWNCPELSEHFAQKMSLGFARPADPHSLAPDPDGPVRFTLDETVAIVEDLVRIADGLRHDDREVDAYLIDLVVNRILERAFGGDR
jgi:hypothetical protein